MTENDPVAGEGLDNPTWENDVEENFDANVLKEAMEEMVARGNELRRNSDLYKEIAAKPDLVSRLRYVYNHTQLITITLVQVMEEIDGIELDNSQFEMLEMLVSFIDEATAMYTESQGNALSVDKAFQLAAKGLREGFPVGFDPVEDMEEPKVPFVAIGNTEPIPAELPEEIKEVIRKNRTEAGYDDNGDRLHNRDIFENGEQA